MKENLLASGPVAYNRAEQRRQPSAAPGVEIATENTPSIIHSVAAGCRALMGSHRLSLSSF